MNCTIDQEVVLNVWLNLYDEGAHAMCHQCYDLIYTGCHFIFQLHKVNNLRIPGHQMESKTAIIVKICVVNIFHFVVGLQSV